MHHQHNVIRFKNNYDYSKIYSYIESKTREIEGLSAYDDPDMIIKCLNNYIHDAHSQPNVKNTKKKEKFNNTNIMNKCNSAFESYTDIIKSNVHTAEEIKTASDKYYKIRNKVTFDILKQEHDEWKNLVANDPHSLWEKIDWKGQVNSKIPIEDIVNNFELLYKTDEKHSTYDINQLQSNVTIPILDDPITLNEISVAVTEMKKGGFDYPLPIIRMLYSLFSPLLIVLLNIMFYVKYPLDCATALLFAIPKKGDLSRSSNYRGIKMMKAIACFFDRIITNRLSRWIYVNEEQSAYQK